MDNLHYKEMVSNLDQLIKEKRIENKKIYLFGHCNATVELAELLLDRGYIIESILDNNPSKQGTLYRKILIVSPHSIEFDKCENIVVCIAARAYASMADQLRRLGYDGKIYKLVDYNSYADYSLSEETLVKMRNRVQMGGKLMECIRQKYSDFFLVFCPFPALGDIYYMMSYLPHYLKKHHINQCVILVVGNACAEVVRLFGENNVETVSQKNMDELIQWALYMKSPDIFIAHQDRPYVIKLHQALYIKRIPLEQIYCCGVFGLPRNTKSVKPTRFESCVDISLIPLGNSVVFSPYAKSVTTFTKKLWKQIVDYYKGKGYECFTNVVGEEQPLIGTYPISPHISEMKSVVEHAGTFVGIRSGLCDILREAKAKKIALYPDYNYCDTQWKAIDMYELEGWKNILVKEDF